MIKDKIKSFRKSFAKTIFDRKERNAKAPDIENAKSVLFLRNDNKIGDMVVSTLIFREVKKAYPQIKIFVLCGKDNKEIIKHNPYVDEIFEVSGSMIKDFFVYKRIRKLNVGIAVDFFPFRPRPAHLMMLRIIRPAVLAGFYKNAYNLYNFSIENSFFDEHITKRYECLLNVFGIKKPSLDYDIFIGNEEKAAVNSLLGKCKSRYKIVINPFAASIHRSFSRGKLEDLIERIKKDFDCCIYILSHGSNYKRIKDLQNDGVFAVKFKSVLETSFLVKEADLVITPDTSVVHIASAFSKKTVALFLDYSHTDEKIDLIWGPNNPNAVKISADTRNGSIDNDIKEIENMDILKAVHELLNEGK